MITVEFLITSLIVVLIPGPGVVFTVSHDRYFLDRTAERIFAFEGNGVIVTHTGNYSEYREFRDKNEVNHPAAAKAAGRSEISKETNTASDTRERARQAAYRAHIPSRRGSPS